MTFIELVLVLQCLEVLLVDFNSIKVNNLFLSDRERVRHDTLGSNDNTNEPLILDSIAVTLLQYYWYQRYVVKPVDVVDFIGLDSV